jgi:hypothetical protein
VRVVLLVWVLVIVPHDPKPWHRQRRQQGRHETQGTEPRDTRRHRPPTHRIASLAAVSHTSHRVPSTTGRGRPLRWVRTIVHRKLVRSHGVASPPASRGGRLPREQRARCVTTAKPRHDLRSTSASLRRLAFLRGKSL